MVIKCGRAIDPETKLDATRDVGINGGRIVAVSETSLTGEHVIEANGLNFGLQHYAFR